MKRTIHFERSLQVKRLSWKKLAVLLSMSRCMVVWRHTWCIMSYFVISVVPWACHTPKRVCSDVSCFYIRLNCELQMLQTSSLCKQTGVRNSYRKVAIYLHIRSFARDWKYRYLRIELYCLSSYILWTWMHQRKTISSPHLSQWTNSL